MDHYNTLGLTGEELKTAKGKGKAQREIILEWFRLHPKAELINPEIHVQTGLKAAGVPLTSVRRAVNDLVKANDLINTYETRPGIYGTANFIFKLNTSEHRVSYKQLTIE